MILGVHKLEGNLLHVLDTEKACQIEGSLSRDRAGPFMSRLGNLFR